MQYMHKSTVKGNVKVTAMPGLEHFLVPGVHGLICILPFSKTPCLKPRQLPGARTELDAAVL